LLLWALSCNVALLAALPAPFTTSKLTLLFTSTGYGPKSLLVKINPSEPL